MYDLKRFLDAQESSYGNAYETALAELKAGRKQSHWIWYIFPQIAGLGRSSTAQFYAIQNMAEAVAYMQHPLLRERLLACCHALLSLPTNNALKVMGWPDNMKLRSCMTLFELAAPECSEFANVLKKFYQGKRDQATLDILDHASDKKKYWMIA